MSKLLAPRSKHRFGPTKCGENGEITARRQNYDSGAACQIRRKVDDIFPHKQPKIPRKTDFQHQKVSSTFASRKSAINFAIATLGTELSISESDFSKLILENAILALRNEAFPERRRAASEIIAKNHKQLSEKQAVIIARILMPTIESTDDPMELSWMSDTLLQADQLAELPRDRAEQIARRLDTNVHNIEQSQYEPIGKLFVRLLHLIDFDRAIVLAENHVRQDRYFGGERVDVSYLQTMPAAIHQELTDKILSQMRASESWYDWQDLSEVLVRLGAKNGVNLSEVPRLLTRIENRGESSRDKESGQIGHALEEFRDQLNAEDWIRFTNLILVAMQNCQDKGQAVFLAQLIDSGNVPPVQESKQLPSLVDNIVLALLASPDSSSLFPLDELLFEVCPHPVLDGAVRLQLTKHYIDVFAEPDFDFQSYKFGAVYQHLKIIVESLTKQDSNAVALKILGTIREIKNPKAIYHMGECCVDMQPEIPEEPGLDCLVYLMEFLQKASMNSNEYDQGALQMTILNIGRKLSPDAQAEICNTAMQTARNIGDMRVNALDDNASNLKAQRLFNFIVASLFPELPDEPQLSCAIYLVEFAAEHRGTPDFPAEKYIKFSEQLSKNSRQRVVQHLFSEMQKHESPPDRLCNQAWIIYRFCIHSDEQERIELAEQDCVAGIQLLMKSLEQTETNPLRVMDTDEIVRSVGYLTTYVSPDVQLRIKHTIGNSLAGREINLGVLRSLSKKLFQPEDELPPLLLDRLVNEKLKILQARLRIVEADADNDNLRALHDLEPWLTQLTHEQKSALANTAVQVLRERSASDRSIEILRKIDCELPQELASEYFARFLQAGTRDETWYELHRETANYSFAHSNQVGSASKIVSELMAASERKREKWLENIFRDAATQLSAEQLKIVNTHLAQLVQSINDLGKLDRLAAAMLSSKNVDSTQVLACIEKYQSLLEQGKQEFGDPSRPLEQFDFQIYDLHNLLSTEHLLHRVRSILGTAIERKKTELNWLLPLVAQSDRFSEADLLELTGYFVDAVNRLPAGEIYAIDEAWSRAIEMNGLAIAKRPAELIVSSLRQSNDPIITDNLSWMLAELGKHMSESHALAIHDALVAKLMEETDSTRRIHYCSALRRVSHKLSPPQSASSIEQILRTMTQVSEPQELLYLSEHLVSFSNDITSDQALRARKEAVRVLNSTDDPSVIFSLVALGRILHQRMSSEVAINFARDIVRAIKSSDDIRQQISLCELLSSLEEVVLKESDDSRWSEASDIAYTEAARLIVIRIREKGNAFQEDAIAILKDGHYPVRHSTALLALSHHLPPASAVEAVNALTEIGWHRYNIHDFVTTYLRLNEEVKSELAIQWSAEFNTALREIETDHAMPNGAAEKFNLQFNYLVVLNSLGEHLPESSSAMAAKAILDLLNHTEVAEEQQLDLLYELNVLVENCPNSELYNVLELLVARGVSPTERRVRCLWENISPQQKISIAIKVTQSFGPGWKEFTDPKNELFEHISEDDRTAICGALVTSICLNESNDETDRYGSDPKQKLLQWVQTNSPHTNASVLRSVICVGAFRQEVLQAIPMETLQDVDRDLWQAVDWMQTNEELNLARIPLWPSQSPDNTSSSSRMADRTLDHLWRQRNSR